MTAAIAVVALVVGFWAGYGWAQWWVRLRAAEDHIAQALRIVQPDTPPEDRPDWPPTKGAA